MAFYGFIPAFVGSPKIPLSIYVEWDSSAKHSKNMSFPLSSEIRFISWLVVYQSRVPDKKLITRWRNSLTFMELEGPLLCSKETYLEPDKPSSYPCTMYL